MHQRINAIDAARGFCLLNIFVNHITLGVMTEASPSKIGFCDSADIFVLLAGISASLAYGGRGGVYDGAAAGRRMWRRALTLYLVNLVIMASSFLIVLAASPGIGVPNPGIAPPELIADAPAYWWEAVSMRQSLGYSMVLRLYVVLMLVGPVYLWLASKRFWYPMLAGGALWLVGGHYGLVESNSLSGDLFAMTVLPWQLVFAAGISFGAAISQGVPLPRSRLLVGAAVLLLVAGPLLFVIGERVSTGVHDWLATRNDRFWTGISKSYQSPLRLLYLFAIAYVVAACPRAPLIRLLHEARPDGLLCRLGRRSLHVFAVGAIFAFGVDLLLWNLIERGLAGQGSIPAVLVEIVLAACGLWLMTRFADRGRPGGKAAPQAGTMIAERPATAG